MRPLPDPAEVAPTRDAALGTDEQPPARSGLGEVIKVYLDVAASSGGQADRPLPGLFFSDNRLSRSLIYWASTSRDLDLVALVAATTHRSVTELEADLRRWINQWNADPKPFVWTKIADAILDTLAAYCQRINGSGH